MVENNFEDMPTDFWNILHAIINNESSIFCPIVKGIFAVGAEGDIYPCHMINGERKCNLGNIGVKIISIL